MKDLIYNLIWSNLFLLGNILMILCFVTEGVNYILAIISGILMGAWFKWTWNKINK